MLLSAKVSGVVQRIYLFLPAPIMGPVRDLERSSHFFSSFYQYLQWMAEGDSLGDDCDEFTERGCEFSSQIRLRYNRSVGGGCTCVHLKQ